MKSKWSPGPKSNIEFVRGKKKILSCHIFSFLIFICHKFDKKQLLYNVSVLSVFLPCAQCRCTAVATLPTSSKPLVLSRLTTGANWDIVNARRRSRWNLTAVWVSQMDRFFFRPFSLPLFQTYKKKKKLVSFPASFSFPVRLPFYWACNEWRSVLPHSDRSSTSRPESVMDAQ